MKQVLMIRENQPLIGWIETRGAKLGASVEVPSEGGYFTVEKVFDYELGAEQVRELEDRARKTFTAQKSYRGNK